MSKSEAAESLDSRLRGNDTEQTRAVANPTGFNLHSLTPVLAASLAVFRDGRVLLASRTQPPLANLFTLPGGKVELGETLEAAALRELMEEVGVCARIIGFNENVEVIHRDEAGAVIRHFVIASFVARWVSGEARTGPEAGAVLWADPLRLGGLAVTPKLPHILRRAKRIADETQ